MGRIGTWAGAVAIAMFVTLSTGHTQPLTNDEIRREVALLKDDLQVLPETTTPRRILRTLRERMLIVMRRSTDSYLTVLRRAFAGRRDGLGGRPNVFVYAREVLGLRPRGNALLGALFRPDVGASGVVTTPEDETRTRRFLARQLIGAGADRRRVRRILRRLQTLPTPIRQGTSVSPDA